jgi:hypothetical protein
MRAFVQCAKCAAQLKIFASFELRELHRFTAGAIATSLLMRYPFIYKYINVPLLPAFRV